MAVNSPTHPLRARLRSIARSWAYTFVRLFLKAGTDRAVILMYHSVGHNALRSTVPPEVFEMQMRYLREKGFTVVSLDTLAEHRAAGSFPPKTVSITFDDGYRDNYVHALPILRKYGFPATVFLLAADVGDSRDVRGVSMEVLSETELRELQEGGVAIGAHSVTHPRFTEISETQAREEAAQSKTFIEHLTRVSCTHFAYPHGRYDAKAIRAVRDAGFKDACTTEDGFVRPHSSSFALPRNAIISTTSLFDFAAIAHVGRLSFARLSRPKTP